MRQKIQELLDKTESERGIKILFAVEAGSRAWGFESQDSDYDVRFVYIPPIQRYLTLDTQRDVIEITHGDIDLVGWDIRKALTLFRKTNPNFIEWLNSPITYSEVNHHGTNLRQDLISCLPEYIGKKAMMSHYHGMAKRNWKEYLQESPVWTKKYLYVIRPLIACTWLQHESTTPSVNFRELLADTSPLLKAKKFENTTPNDIIRSIRELIERKIAGDELSKGPRIPALHHYISSEIVHFKKVSQNECVMPKEKFLDFTARLTQLFHDLLNFHTEKDKTLITTRQVISGHQT